MNASQLAEEFEASVRAAGEPERAAREKAYLKSDLDHLGANLPAIRSAAKDLHRAHPDLSHRTLIALVRRLWRQPVHELRTGAIELLWLYRRSLAPDDIELIETLLRQAKTWALVDSLATATVGYLVERDSSLNAVLDRWAQDDDFWIRRSALLALLKPLRRGEGDFDRFGRYADALLEETEFFIRKAIGWVLRDTARKRPQLVTTWLEPRAHRASGVTMREAVKPLPVDTAERLMKIYKSKNPVSNAATDRG